MIGTTLSTVLKILSGMFFLMSGAFWKKMLNRETINYHLIFYRVIGSLLSLFVISILFESETGKLFSSSVLQQLKLEDWIVCVGICSFSFWGLYFYTNALQAGRFLFVTPLMVISSGISLITSLIVYDEKISNHQIVGLIIIICAVLIHQRKMLRTLKISRELLLTLLCGIFWGIAFVFYLIPIRKFGILNFTVILEICVFISCIFLIVRKERKLFPPALDRQQYILCAAMGILVALGSLLSNYTLTTLPVSVNILIGIFFEVIVVIVGLFFFRERLTSNDWFMVVMVSIAALLLLI